jgi:hypothetical protein
MHIMDLHKTIVAENEHTYGAPGHSPQLVDLTLQEIVRDGKVTNPYQLFVLGHVAMFFKNGLKSIDLHLENPISFNTDATSSAVKSAMKALSDEEQVKLASYLLDCIKAGECMMYDKQCDISAWMNFVLQKQ